MRRIVAGCLIVAAGLALAVSGAAGSGTALKVTVSPKSGSPGTRFVVRFRARSRTGAVGVERRRYQVQARGRGSGCAQSVVANVPATRRGQRVSVWLPSLRCAASYRGKVTETIGPHCVTGQPCPEFATQIRTIARFTFEVVRSGDASAPTFTGLKSAVQCFPGPMTPGETRPVNLSWKAAADNVSPSAKITYEVFTASAAGGENFSQPSWTTQGATGFTTPNLQAGLFFVVRARDQAGNEDHNMVERQAQNPCL